VVFSVFWGGCKKKLTDFGQLFCYPKFFKNKKKKIDRFRPTFLADRKEVGRNSVSPTVCLPKKKTASVRENACFLK
jgi:hypothetical protein